MSNPLLHTQGLPLFSQIRPDQVVPAIQAIIAENRSALAAQLQSLQAISWDTLVAPIEAREDRLNNAFSPVSHLNSVQNSPALREAYQEAIALLTDYSTEMGQNRALFEAYQQLQASPAFAEMSRGQQTTLEQALRDFKLAGVDLPEAQQQRYAQVKSRLAQLTSAFANNVLDATQGWFQHLPDNSRLAGLSAAAQAQAAQTAAQKGLPGYVLTLDGPVYLQVMTQAQDRALREAFYTAYMTRASDQGPCAGQWDNQPLLEEILSLRQELAQLLGFAQYADLSLATKMADSPEQVLAFLLDLAEKSRPMAEQELQQLRQWTQAQYGIDTLEIWDIPYYSERLKEAQYSVSQEALRVYFPLPRVLDGLFATLERLFGVQVKPQTEFDSYHRDVQLFGLYRNQTLIAQCYLDLFAREGKKGGAWMGTCRVRRSTCEGLQLPVAYLVCNFSAPVGQIPSLLTHNDVITLFHEFGHGLHHMLTQMDVAGVSGINGVAWDAVELPSQFMENWCWQEPVLQALSGHHETGEPLPSAMIERLLAAKNFQSALQMLRQVEFALFDMRLHRDSAAADFPGVQPLLEQVRQQVAVVMPPAFNRFALSFTHIFAGGYAAGYYSYKWAEVLSADAFAAFEENGLDDPATGEAFLREILQKGGSESAMQLFKNFRGREPRVDALLRHAGIAA